MSNLLSLCMIVKNEENVLARCLDSVKTLVDEMIIVDTGSTDKTKQIALQYTDKVFDFGWTNDFAAARNESIRHATGKWILVLDADEYVQEHDPFPLRHFLMQQDQNQAIAYQLPIHNLLGDGSDMANVMISLGARLFANNGLIRYQHPIHEQLYTTRGSLAMHHLQYSIFHTGYIESVVEQKNKSERNLSLLKNLERTTAEQEAYYWFCLGNEYNTAKQSEDALEAYLASYSLSKPEDAWFHHLSISLIQLELLFHRYQSAYQHIQSGLSYRSQYADYHYLEGLLLEELGYWELASDKYKHCLVLIEDENVMSNTKNQPAGFMFPFIGKTVTLQRLGYLAQRQGQIIECTDFWIKALKESPNEYILIQQLISHLIQYEHPENIVGRLNALYSREKPLHPALLMKMALHCGNLPLSIYYAHVIQNLSIPIEAADSFMFSMLQHQTSDDNSKLSLTMPNALMGAIVLQNKEIASYAITNTHACIELAEHAIACFTNEHAVYSVKSEMQNLWTESLLTLYKFQYHEIYYILLEKMADEDTINSLAVKLYEANLVDGAIQLFELALENGIINAAALQALGHLQYRMGEKSLAAHFYLQALELKPSELLIGRVIECGAAEQIAFHQQHHQLNELQWISSIRS
jgi:glycosyltransferase involved in cell wall biosynthesis